MLEINTHSFSATVNSKQHRTNVNTSLSFCCLTSLKTTSNKNASTKLSGKGIVCKVAICSIYKLHICFPRKPQSKCSSFMKVSIFLQAIYKYCRCWGWISCSLFAGRNFHLFFCSAQLCPQLHNLKVSIWPIWIHKPETCLYIYIIFVMFLKEVSSAHQGCIYLMKNKVKTVILWNGIKKNYDNGFLF